MSFKKILRTSEEYHKEILNKKLNNEKVNICPECGKPCTYIRIFKKVSGFIFPNYAGVNEYSCECGCKWEVID